MRTPQQALQDAIDSGAVAAFIAGKPVEVASINYNPDKFRPNTAYMPEFMNVDLLWRSSSLYFPEPPAGESWHNPDNLTPEQVGEGYRLLLVSERKALFRRFAKKPAEFTKFIQAWHTKNNSFDYGENIGNSPVVSYRVPSSAPFHWDAPKRVPLAPEDFIGAWINTGKSYWPIDHVTEDKVRWASQYSSIAQLIDMAVTVRLANTTEFVPCYREEVV